MKQTQISIPAALAIFAAAMLALTPLLAIAHEGESIMPNLFGAAYLGVLVVFSRTRCGARCGALIDRANKRLFGWL